MREAARRYGNGADEQTWAIAGLLHDADYERWPDQHPKRVVDWLREQGEAVHPLKPVESGTDEADGSPADAALLARCAGLPGPADCNVFALAEPLAPVVAARRAGM